MSTTVDVLDLTQRPPHDASLALRDDDPAQLAQAWRALLEREPKLRIRDAAERLGTSEAALLATQVGQGVTRLRCDLPAIFQGLNALGRVMALTRNEWAVIEKHGVYDQVDIGQQVGLVLTEDIDLRLFPPRFSAAYAEVKPVEGTQRHLRSIQLFGPDGLALHKVYAKKDAQAAAFDALVASLAHPEQTTRFEHGQAASPKPIKPDDQIDVAGLRQAWLDMQDTHEFFGLLRRFEVAREQSFRLAPEGHALAIPTSCFDTMLELASARELPIMIFVGSPGCIEIHTGPIKRVVEMGDWINVLDPDFNLHLDRRGVATAWIVRKPTADGVVTSLELFDARGELILMAFGARKPGIPEDERWRDLIQTLIA